MRIERRIYLVAGGPSPRDHLSGECLDMAEQVWRHNGLPPALTPSAIAIGIDQHPSLGIPTWHHVLYPSLHNRIPHYALYKAPMKGVANFLPRSNPTTFDCTLPLEAGASVRVALWLGFRVQVTPCSFPPSHPSSEAYNLN